MQHRLARRIIPLILGGSGFDQRCLALVDAAQLCDIPGIQTSTAEKALSAAASLNPDHASEPKIKFDCARGAEDLSELANWLLPEIIDNPAQSGRQIGCFYALALIWGHATIEERQALISRWYASLQQRNGPTGSFLSKKTLCDWQMGQPTVSNEAPPKASVIHSMLEQKTAQAAYYILASYLGTNMDLPTLTRILGAISVHVLLYRFDNKAYIISALAGIVSLHHMCSYADPQHLVTLLSQLTHQIWWCRNDGDLDRLEEGSSASMSLQEAITVGDMTAARRAARIEAIDNDNFWRSINDILNTCIDSNYSVWTRGLTAVRVLHQRSDGNSVSPDDAAAIGATFAAIHHLCKHGTAKFQRVK